MFSYPKNEYNRYLTKTDLVYKALQEAILTGKLAPGSRLIIKQICSELDVSDSPVREALKQLEATGLITIKPNVGAVVVTPSAEWIEDIFVIRAAIEGMALRMSVPNLSEDDLDKIKELASHMNDAAASGDYAGFSHFDREFHRTTMSKAPYPGLLSLVEELFTKSEFGRAIFGLLPNSVNTSIWEHDQIIKAIMEKNLDRVETIVRKQKFRVGKELANLIRKNGAFRTMTNQPVD